MTGKLERETEKKMARNEEDLLNFGVSK